MIHRFGQRIVTVHPGLDPALQDALLSAIEGVLASADVERLRIDPSPERDLQVCGELPGSSGSTDPAAVTE